jgi:FixJ family two-component response regulator
MTDRRERTVYVVDDDEAVCDSLKLLLRTAGLHVETFPSAYAFLQRYRGTRPACVVLDVRMPGMSGLTLQEELADRNVDLPIVFLTGHADVPMAVDAVKKGAFDFIEKPFERHRLLCAVLDALEADADAHTRAARRGDAESRLAGLSARERAVLDGVLAGKNTRDIAAALFVSPKTVEFHRARIKRKLGVATTADLFRVALLAGADTVGAPAPKP